jgi:hypothetical protein
MLIYKGFESIFDSLFPVFENNVFFTGQEMEKWTVMSSFSTTCSEDFATVFGVMLIPPLCVSPKMHT